jgi:hypothetical protein
VSWPIRIAWEGIVVDTELVADSGLLADAVQGDPRARGVRDVVVEVVARGPARHGALLDAVCELPLLRVLQQRHEPLGEVLEVLVHRPLLVAPDEPAHRVRAHQHGRVHDPLHEVVLLATQRRVVVQHVVEVPDVREADAALLQRGPRPLRAVPVEGLAQVERVGHGVEHGLGRHVGLARMQRRGELDVVGADLAREGGPVLDRAVRIGVADLARRQLLQGGGQHADLHELRAERLHGHLGPPSSWL